MCSSMSNLETVGHRALVARCLTFLLLFSSCSSLLLSSCTWGGESARTPRHTEPSRTMTPVPTHRSEIATTVKTLKHVSGWISAACFATAFVLQIVGGRLFPDTIVRWVSTLLIPTGFACVLLNVMASAFLGSSTIVQIILLLSFLCAVTLSLYTFIHLLAPQARTGRLFFHIDER